MNRICILLGGAALAAATAGHAQLLGGGLGGGLGGAMGNAGGNISGGFGGTLRSQQLSEAARGDRLHTRELRNEQRRSDRTARTGNAVGGASGGGFAGTALSGAIGGAASSAGTIAGSASGDTGHLDRGDSGASSVAGGQRQVAGDVGTSGSLSLGHVAGSGYGSVAGHAGGFRARSYAFRTNAAAGARGLRRAGQSALGVAVYLPAAAGEVPVIVARSHPVAVGGGYAYGGGGDYYDGGYHDAGPTYYEETPVVAAAPDPAYMDRQYNDLRDDAAGTGVIVERRGADLIVQLPADVTFAFDRADIQPRFVPALDAVARTIASYRDTDVEILGYTDSVGSDAYNYALSQRRGSSVADFLVSRQAAPDRLIVEGMGKSEPVATNATVAGRAANRRVEIVLHSRTA